MGCNAKAALERERLPCAGARRCAQKTSELYLLYHLSPDQRGGRRGAELLTSSCAAEECLSTSSCAAEEMLLTSSCDLKVAAASG